jgi:hypothetical protein
MGKPPKQTAGYSGTPLPQKLGIKPAHQIALLRAPTGFDETLGPLPPGVNVARRLAPSRLYDVIVFFTKSRVELAREFESLSRRLQMTGGLWISWPKKTSGVETDLTEDIIRVIGLAEGLVDNKVCAVDETWSGLRFVIRVQDRAKGRK